MAAFGEIAAIRLDVVPAGVGHVDDLVETAPDVARRRIERVVAFDADLVLMRHHAHQQLSLSARDVAAEAFGVIATGGLNLFGGAGEARLEAGANAGLEIGGLGWSKESEGFGGFIRLVLALHYDCYPLSWSGLS